MIGLNRVASLVKRNFEDFTYITYARILAQDAIINIYVLVRTVGFTDHFSVVRMYQFQIAINGFITLEELRDGITK